MALTFPAAYHNRNVIFFSLVYIALLWLINFSSFFLTVSLRFNGHLTVYWRKISNILGKGNSPYNGRFNMCIFIAPL